MSAMPARVSELAERTEVGSAPYPSVAGLTGRAQRRAERMAARKARQRWAIFGCSILGSAFALTVGILDVLH
jgi:hypothetical protein